jgi:hypothetical protein
MASWYAMRELEHQCVREAARSAVGEGRRGGQGEDDVNDDDDDTHSHTWFTGCPGVA